MTEWRHLLDVPGGAPIELELRPDAACGSCRLTLAGGGDVVHGAECPAARSLAARAARDITTDGAGELAEAARTVLAAEYADEVLEDDGRLAAMRAALSNDSDELTSLRRELVLAHASGFKQAERALISMATASARRIRDELDQLIDGLAAWAPPPTSSEGESR